MLYCATSVMIPDYDVPGTVKILAELGFRAVEWRARYYDGNKDAPPSFWGRHETDIDPDNLEKRAPEIRKVCEDYGVVPLVLAPRAAAGDEEECRKLFAGAEALGCRMVRISAACDSKAPYPEQLRQAEDSYAKCADWAAPHGVKVLMEIHTGTVAVSCAQAFLVAKGLSPDRFGVIWDLNNLAHQGFSLPYRHGLELLGDYLAHTHIGNRCWSYAGLRKNGTVAWETRWASLPGGVHDIFEAFRALRATGYGGALSLEDFRPGDTREKLAEGLHWMRAAWESAE